MSDVIPKNLMNEGRLAWAKSIGLAQRQPYMPETQPVDATPPTAPSVAPHIDPTPALQPAAQTHLAVVGRAITGREWLVLQVPGGQVRWQGNGTDATAEARRLAHDESAAFVVFRPVVALAPETTIKEEAISG